jgi:hypothetical protein
VVVVVEVVVDEGDVDVTVEVVSIGTVVLVVAIGTLDVLPGVPEVESGPDVQPAANSSSADADTAAPYERPSISDAMHACGMG